MASSSSSQSPTVRFSRSSFSKSENGGVATPRCTCHRNTTAAVDLLYRFPISATTGLASTVISSSRLNSPYPSGEYAWNWIPFISHIRMSCCCWQYGCDSHCSTAGLVSVPHSSSCSSVTLKLHTPTLRASPASLHAAMAFHVSWMVTPMSRCGGGQSFWNVSGSHCTPVTSVQQSGSYSSGNPRLVPSYGTYTNAVGQCIRYMST
mmetsp:Transcript_32422/g.84867  ORF Transcript_32422/g.84867 Transcript_32422/m.84867 type:complete len:206 (-) Transcript_32422:459-1076(-)